MHCYYFVIDSKGNKIENVDYLSVGGAIAFMMDEDNRAYYGEMFLCITASGEPYKKVVHWAPGMTELEEIEDGKY